MIPISTRQNRKGKFWCNATLKGMDYSFEGYTMGEAQSQMKAHLNQPYFAGLDVEWLPVKYYLHDPMERYKEPFKRTWIDHKPFA